MIKIAWNLIHWKRLLGLVLALMMAGCSLPLSTARLTTPAGPHPVEILYLYPSRQPDLWITPAAGGQPLQLTRSGGKVLDAAPAAGGDLIYYTQKNEQNGADLWQVGRDGQSAVKILDCGPDLCTAAAPSPDGKHLAYQRRRAGMTPQGGMGAPQVWLLTLLDGSTDLLLADPNLHGIEPAWSPDGLRLAFYDEASVGVWLVQMADRQTHLIPTDTWLGVTWQPDGGKMFYLQLRGGGEVPVEQVQALRLADGQSDRFLGEDPPEEDYSLPVFSSDGQWMVIAARAAGSSTPRQLWLSRADGSQRQEIVVDRTASYAAYSWSPNGTRLVFQRLDVGSSSARPEVWVWERESGHLTLIAQDASRPRWLP